MNSELTLFIFLFLLFILESLFYLPRNSILFNLTSTSKFGLKNVESYLGSIQNGFILSNIFPPFGFVFISTPPKVAFNNVGIISFEPLSLTELRVSKKFRFLYNWNDIHKIETRSHKLFLNGRLFLRFKSRSEADYLARKISEIKNSPISQRESIIMNDLENEFNYSKIETKLKSLKIELRFLNLLCNILWIFIFIVSPIVSFIFGFSNVFFIILSLYLIIHFLIIGVFINYALKSRHYHTKFDFISDLIKIGIYPPGILRAADLLSINQLQNNNALLLSYSLLDEKHFKIFARRFILDLRYPNVNEKDYSNYLSILKDYNKLQLDLINRFLDLNGYNLDEIIRPVLSDDSNIKSYCPRCFGEYILEHGICADCINLELIKINN